MSYPQPEHRKYVDVGQLVFREIGSYGEKHKEMLAKAVKALYEYMRSNTFHFHGSSEGQDGTYKKDSALTPDGIVVHFCGNYTAGINRTPRDMHFELLSFQTPVDQLRGELTDIVKKACKEVRGE